MSLTLSQLFPGIETGLNRIGFLFGAGTSKEAGYPLMGDLTKTVVSNLSSALKATLDEILAAKSLTYDPAAGTPNIEIISDLVTEYFITTQEPKYGDLEPPPSGKLSPVLLTTRGLEEMTSAALQRGCQS